MPVDVKAPYANSLSGVDNLGQQSLNNYSTLVGLKQQRELDKAQTAAAKAAQKYSKKSALSANLTAKFSGGNMTAGSISSGGTNFGDFKGLNEKARSKAINAAKKYLGTWYSWGGGGMRGPSKGIGRGRNTVGFDCSGLVRYAYNMAGKKMPRHSSAQAAMGRRTSVYNLRPGDLIARPGHIVMYIGGGKIIEAPSTGKKVRIRSMKQRGIRDGGGWFGVRVKFAGE